MKTTLAKTSFAVFSVLIIALASWQARGENWLVWLLAVLAAGSAIWALAGVYDPANLFFAHKTNQTRENAFFFPFKLFLIFAFCGGLESSGVIANVVAGGAEPGPTDVCTLIIGGLFLPGMAVSANHLHDIPNHY